MSVLLPDLAFTANGPVIPKGKGSQCVADTDLMRREHMNLLNHQRDETVIKGIRDQPFSLAECVDCHAQTDAANQPVRIDAEGQFCESCHSYAAVKIDCFSCHAAVPQVEKTGAWNNPAWYSSTASLASVMRSQLLVTERLGAELSDYLNDNRSDKAHWNPRAKR